MFINEKVLIRLMKEAYKGTGVYIGRFDGWYVIAGGYWEARIAVGCASNKTLACIVELSGSLPGEHEAWTADKEKNQLEAFNKFEEFKREGHGEMAIRRLVLLTPGGSGLAVLQQLEDNMVLTVKLDLVNAALGETDSKNGEEKRIGPVYDGSGGAYWYTNQAEWYVRQTRYDDLEDIISLLESAPLQLKEEDRR